MPQLISSSQSAFVHGHLITNEVLVAHETMNHLNTKRQDKARSMVIKLDMSKTYDKVEWNFLKTVMHIMGLEESLMWLIMNCVQTVTFFILINGEPLGFISPTRGLCQGGPFSSYLFIFCNECLITFLYNTLH